jgi:hypothetical protein
MKIERLTGEVYPFRLTLCWGVFYGGPSTKNQSKAFWKTPEGISVFLGSIPNACINGDLQFVIDPLFQSIEIIDSKNVRSIVEQDHLGLWRSRALEKILGPYLWRHHAVGNVKNLGDWK